MSRAEKFIQDCTRNCSQLHYNSACTLRHCITPDQAREAVEIARGEMIEKACMYLNEHRNGVIDDEYIINLKQAMEYEEVR